MSPTRAGDRFSPPLQRPAAAVLGCARGVVWLLERMPSSPAAILRTLGLSTLACTAALSTTGACGALDFQCKADAWAEGVVEGLQATFSSLTQSMIQGIFTGSLGTIGAGGWQAGTGVAARVGAIMAIIVVALAAVQIATTLVAKQREGVLRAVIGALLAWPVCSATIWASFHLVQAIDAIANNMVEDSHLETLSRLTDFTMTVGAATPLTAGLVGVFFVFCVFIPTVLLSLMMALRNYGIVLAIAVAPVSVMVWGFSAVRGMSRGWLKVVLALMLTKPVLAIALVLAAEMIVDSANQLDIGGFLTGIAGLLMAVFAPFAAMGMVSGAMAVADTNVMRGAEAKISNAGSRAMHAVGGRAQRAGSGALKTAAMSNPKTAALWSLAHGERPAKPAAPTAGFQPGQAQTGQGETGQGQPGRDGGSPAGEPGQAGQPGPGGPGPDTGNPAGQPGQTGQPGQGHPEPGQSGEPGQGQGRPGRDGGSPAAGEPDTGSRQQRPGGREERRPSGGPKFA